ncbi:MAG: hypothetical protein ABIY55_30295 [Kofleriaceae bacterium]
MVTATGPIPALHGITPNAPDAEAQAVAARLPTTAPDAADVTELSQLGALLSQLTDLQRTDPAHAQRALRAMASELSGRAALSGGDAQLRALANAFARAAQTGDLSEVRPLGPPRSDELIEDTAPNPATPQGRAARYTLGDAPARPELEALLEDALSRTVHAQRSADGVEPPLVEQAASDQRRADRVEPRLAE